jgi:DNA-binding FrmR family transcriptional regulator
MAYRDPKAATLTRINKIEGQVRGLARMIEADGPCVEVLTQIAACTRALHAVALSLLDTHLACCAAEGAVDADVLEERLREINAAIRDLVED